MGYNALKSNIIHAFSLFVGDLSLFSVKTLFSFKPDSVKFLALMPKLYEFGFWQSRLMPPHKPDRTLKLCSSKCFFQKIHCKQRYRSD